MPELRTDSAFMEDLHRTLLENNDYLAKMLTNPRDKEWRHCHLSFEKIDSVNYTFVVLVCDIPDKNAIGFLNHKDFTYWFDGEIPIGVVLEKKSMKSFSYKEQEPGPYDPPFWTFRYNLSSKAIKIINQFGIEF